MVVEMLNLNIAAVNTKLLLLATCHNFNYFNILITIKYLTEIINLTLKIFR